MINSQFSIINFRQEAQAPLAETAEEGVQLMSNTQLQTELEALGVGEAENTELNEI